MKEKKNTTISAQNLQRAERIMKLRGFDDYSEFVSALIREEWERRQGPVVFRDAETSEPLTPPPTPPTKPVTYRKASKRDIQRKILDSAKREAEKHQPSQPRPK